MLKGAGVVVSHPPEHIAESVNLAVHVTDDVDRTFKWSIDQRCGRRNITSPIEKSGRTPVTRASPTALLTPEGESYDFA